MNDVDFATLSKGLHYEDSLPLRWQQAIEPSTPAGVLVRNQANEQLLRHLAAIEEVRSEGSDEDGQVSHDIQRLESKINLLMDMMGQLLTRQMSLPEPAPVRLGADAMQWICPPGAAPSEGMPLLVEVYLNRRYPSPLALGGAVESVRPEAGGGVSVTLRYAGLSEGLRSALEKIIFRQHRRLVAQARQAARFEY